MKCGINIILQLLLWYFYYGNGKSNRGTEIVVERVFSLAKTIVVDVFVIYIPRIPLWYFLLWAFHSFTLTFGSGGRGVKFFQGGGGGEKFQGGLTFFREGW